LLKFTQLLPKYREELCIIEGDFNAVVETKKDRSGHPFPWDQKISRTLKWLRKETDTYDVWHIIHLEDKEYTFYSAMHRSYSEIDAFYALHSVLTQSVDTEIETFTLSDHAPMNPIFKKQSIPKTKFWCLNTSLLKDEGFTQLIWKTIINKGSVWSQNTVWDMFKAHCRGVIISYAINKKQQMPNQRKELEKQLDEAEKVHMVDPKNEQLFVRVTQVCSNLQALIDRNMEFAFFRTKKKYYEEGNTAGALLAHQLKKCETVFTITAIKTKSGSITRDPKKINTEFLHFYKDLYTSQKLISSEEDWGFFTRAKLPWISGEDKALLDGLLKATEVDQDLTNSSSSSVP
uniref:Endonuclease/exonuclease/phosphatase domain-containing protein n=1 Tax=Latimeria chalumnae TaxID=7897 RepID=H3AB40_LATCH